ncbi:MAG: helix-turn-helix domain-containing protein [Rhodobacteraceae bacterium]|nr:helix-turn-helix domain-containing protein [Paracoccaceae bacterium]
MQTQSDGFTRLILAAPFTDHATRQGIDVAPVLEALGLSAEMMRDPTTTVHVEIVYGLCNMLAEQSDDPHLGCHVAETFDLASWPPLAQAGRTAGSIGELLVNYLLQVPRESSSVRHALTVEVEGAIYAVHRLVETRNAPIQVEGFGMALHLRLLQLVLGSRWSPDAVLLRTSFPEALPRRFMNVSVRKANLPGMELRFPPSWLFVAPATDLRWSPETPKPDPADLSILSALQGAARPNLADRTLNAEALAAMLGLSVNRLEAALHQHQTTVPRELKALRIAVAKEELVQTDRSIAEIGAMLGYDDQSHFARFFRSQTGQSPRAYRKSGQRS